MNYFQFTSPNVPYHLSVGAVVFNPQGEIACFYSPVVQFGDSPEFEDIYTLMRETIEPGETVEQALARGLEEELGVSAELKAYLGDLTSQAFAFMQKVDFEKTTLYFLMEFTEQIGPGGQEEVPGEPKWLQPDVLKQKIAHQIARYPSRPDDVDERLIIDRAIKVRRALGYQE